MYFNRKERRNWWKLRIDWFVQTFWKETRFWFRLVFVRRAAIGRAATGAVQSAATLHLCFSHCQGERKMQKHMESVYKSIYNRYAETHTHSHTHTHTQTRSWWKDLLNPPQKKKILVGILNVENSAGTGTVGIWTLSPRVHLVLEFPRFNWKMNHFPPILKMNFVEKITGSMFLISNIGLKQFRCNKCWIDVMNCRNWKWGRQPGHLLVWIGFYKRMLITNWKCEKRTL